MSIQLQGVVIPYTDVVTAKTWVKKWSRGSLSGVFGVGQEVKDKFETQLSGQDAIEEGETMGSIGTGKRSRVLLQCGQAVKQQK